MPYPMTPVSLVASQTLRREVHANRPLLLNLAGGMTITLPAAVGTGDEYEIIVGTTFTGNGIIKVADNTDTFSGVLGLSTDIGGTNMLATGTDDTITMNGSTTGGLKGSKVKFRDVATNLWSIEGDLICTGVEASPFSATV